MNGLDTLAFWSLVALVVRVAAVGILIYVGMIQVKQFSYKSELQPLKKALIALIALLAISNIPIMYLHIERIISHTPSAGATAFATVTNAISVLLAALMLLLIYKFASSEE